MPRKVLIVGGVAGGAACAARLRRLDEQAVIIMFERGPHVSYANCGLPYYVGDVITEEDKLLVVSAEQWARQFNVEVRTRHEVVGIDRARQEIEVCDLGSGRRYRETYDALVLAPGAAPVRPNWPGIDLPGVFTLRTIADARAMREWINARQPSRAVVVGAGFLGVEMVENLVRRGLRVTLLEQEPQVLPMLDFEMAQPAMAHLESQRVDVRVEARVVGLEAAGQDLVVLTSSGERHAAGIVLLALGVKPETSLAQAAGLAIGETGGIRVDEQMRTSDPRIWAVGDAVEVRDWVTGQFRLAALAGLASRQGRIAADSICGRPSRFRGAQVTWICGFFGMTAAMTGAGEKALRAAGFTDYQAVYLHPMHHAGYYPGARRLHMKLIFAQSDGRILGAQAVGEEGVDKRIDVLATAIQHRATVFDLEQAELCYAPQYGSARDPVNLAGMVAANVLRGDAPLACWRELEEGTALLLDVREPDEFARDHIEGSINIPLGELRRRLAELPRDREIWVSCAVGQRAYYALRLLLQHGFRARLLSGGYLTYCGWYP